MTGVPSTSSPPAPLPFRVVDAFTSSPFSGNPASIVLFPSVDDPRSTDDCFMLNLAREFRHQETAFLVPRPDTDGLVTYGLRWFTPTVEFPLCGHATLASAHFLFSELHQDADRLRFETSMSGTLFASQLSDRRIELDFPADVSVVSEVDPYEEEDLREKLQHMSAALAAAVVRIGRGKLGWIVELKQDFGLEEAQLDTAPLRSLDGYFVMTQPGKAEHAGFDIYSRVFDPNEPAPEDAVTGSAHCMLAPYWLTCGSSRLPYDNAVKLKRIRAEQGGARQGQIEAEWDVENWRVKLRGNAVTVMEGTLRL